MAKDDSSVKACGWSSGLKGSIVHLSISGVSQAVLVPDEIDVINE